MWKKSILRTFFVATHTTKRSGGPFLVIVHIWGIRKIELDAANGFLLRKICTDIFQAVLSVVSLCDVCGAGGYSCHRRSYVKCTDRISESRDEPAECADSIHGAKW